ncbi:MAG: Gfo/Idh/MocA family oxidoreductase [Acidimicrobiia bacterium]|nr:Gfo/Idh/MocA family oxidoreductase [Acidimicrobiia bacterium]
MSDSVPRVGLVGVGYWGKNLARNFSSLGALAAICDSRDETLAEMATLHPEAEALSSYDRLLADESIDAVAIASPAVEHESMVRRALEAGKDVFVEKPLALSAAAGRDLVDLAAESSRILMVGHLLWYHPAVLRLEELVTKGDLGRLQYIYSHRLNLGRFRSEENILWSFAPHDFSVVLGLVGETPTHVGSQGGAYLNHDVADVTTSELAFPSGVKGHVFVSWLHPFKEQRLVVVGSEAMAVFEDTSPGHKLLLYPHRIDWHEGMPVPSRADAQPVDYDDSEEPLRVECAHFLECVVTRSTPRTDGEEGLRVLEVLERCQAALER